MPHLVGSGPLVAGQPIHLILTQTLESSLAFMVLGASASYTSIRGGILVPTADAILPFITGPTGSIALTANWPAGVPTGTSYYVQSWITDDGGPYGLAASNGVVATAP